MELGSVGRAIRDVCFLVRLVRSGTQFAIRKKQEEENERATRPGASPPFGTPPVESTRLAALLLINFN